MSRIRCCSQLFFVFFLFDSRTLGFSGVETLFCLQSGEWKRVVRCVVGSREGFWRSYPGVDWDESWPEGLLFKGVEVSVWVCWERWIGGVMLDGLFLFYHW